LILILHILLYLQTITHGLLLGYKDDTGKLKTVQLDREYEMEDRFYQVVCSVCYHSRDYRKYVKCNSVYHSQGTKKFVL